MHLDLLPSLRAELISAGFTVESLRALWGGEADAALARGHRLPALQAIDGDGSARAVLARLFVLGAPSARGEAFGTLGIDGAAALGLVRAEGSLLVPLLDLRPYDFVDGRGVGAWWIASDLGEIATGRALREDHVLGVGGASLTLSGLMIPDEVDSVLDLGTGCGIQAMHASRWARRVVATDISARALELARFNAALNGIDTIEFRLGSLFEPVVGERFDRIVSNPPFVITPRVDGMPAYEYRDGGLIGDGIVEAVVLGASDHLVPGGIAQLLGNWEYHAGRDGLKRVGDWIDTAGLDAWVVEREQQDAALYAETWIRDGGTRPGTPEFERLFGTWLDDFSARGVERVGFGYVLLRRPADRVTLRRLEQLHGGLGSNSSGLGRHLAASLLATDWLSATDDAGLLGAHLAVAADVTEERHYWPGDEHPVVMNLVQGGGFARSVPLDTGLAALVGACDGELSVGAICAAIAQLLEVDDAALTEELLPGIRSLVADGFLVRSRA